MVPPIAKFIITLNSFLTAIVWVDTYNLIKNKGDIK